MAFKCLLLSKTMVWERARSGWLASRSGLHNLAGLAQSNELQPLPNPSLKGRGRHTWLGIFLEKQQALPSP